MLKRICVFCGSSAGVRNSYAAAAVSLAQYMASSGLSLVYGGSNVGLMGILARRGACRRCGSHRGDSPRPRRKRSRSSWPLGLRIVESMHQRKALMAELSDAFLAMPGGFGTFEEFCEVLTWTQLGLQTKPCGLLNIDGYYDLLLRLYDHAVAQQFLKPKHRPSRDGGQPSQNTD